MALRSVTAWDVSGLMDEFKQERQEEKKMGEEQRKRVIEEKKVEKERIRLAKEMGIRSSKYIYNTNLQLVYVSQLSTVLLQDYE